MPIGSVEKKTSHIEDLLAKVRKTFTDIKDFLQAQRRLNQFAQSEMVKLMLAQKDLKAIAKKLESLEVDAQNVKEIHRWREKLLEMKEKVLEQKRCYSQELMQDSPKWAKLLLAELSKVEDILDDILEDLALAPALLKLTSKADIPGKPWREVWASSRSK